MIDTDKYEETDHPELVEFEGETLGDTLTNLITEVKRLREDVKVLSHAAKYWESIARGYAKILNSTNLPPEMIE